MASKVALIDYGSGNLRSAEKALARAAAEGATGHEITVTSDPDVAAKAERIVLPGVGAFADCMNGLNGVPGMVAALDDAVRKHGVPFLGICVGMQLLASVGREFGDHPGLGWIDGEVVIIKPSRPEIKVPHMGWNDLRVLKPHPVLDGIETGANAYFVHSYKFVAKNSSDVLATTEYDGTINAVIRRGNIVGTQFHPEKSQAVGLRLLQNFLKWKP